MVYLFRCTVCNHEDDVECSPEEVSRKEHRCSRCGSPSRRVFTLGGIQFVGPGFHVNDYGSRKSQP